MAHHLDTGQRAVDGGRLPDVADDQPRIRGLGGSSRGRAGRGQVEADDVVTGAAELGGDRGADEAGGAGDEDAHQDLLR
jgi:hypothetical protein